MWIRPLVGVRGYVSLSILLVHAQTIIGWWPRPEALRALRSPWFFSVEMLFLLGGFVALLPLVRYGAFPGKRWYAIRRAGRLLPVYWLTIALAVVLGGLLRPVSYTPEGPHDFVAVLAHLAFVQHIAYPLYQSGFGVQTIVWTMTIVACFYVLFAFCAPWYARHPLLGLAAAALVSVLWRTQVTDPGLYLQFPLFLSDFAIGMTAAWVFGRISFSERQPGARPAAVLSALALAAFVALFYAAGLPIARLQSVPYREGAALALGVPAAFAAFLVFLPFTPRWFQWPFVNRAASTLGDISYALFLLHYLIMLLVLRYVHIPRDGSFRSLVELVALVFPLSATAAWLATRYLEAPLRRRAQRWAKRFARPDASPDRTRRVAFPRWPPSPKTARSRP